MPSSSLDQLELTGLPLRACLPYHLEISDEDNRFEFEADVARYLGKLTDAKKWCESLEQGSFELLPSAHLHEESCEAVMQWIEAVVDDSSTFRWRLQQLGWPELLVRLERAADEFKKLFDASDADERRQATCVEEALPVLHTLFDAADRVAAKRQLVEVSISGPTDLLQACCDALDEEERMELLSSPNGLIGHVSPLAVLSLEAEELRQMGVSPERARFYSFFYPCPQLAGCMLSSEKPLQALVTLGGFIYFDRNGLLISCNTFTSEKQSTTLSFEHARPLESRIARSLFQAGRFQVITIKALNDQGARRFAWLLGNETDLAPHGAFCCAKAVALDPATSPLPPVGL